MPEASPDHSASVCQQSDVLRLIEIDTAIIMQLLAEFGLTLVWIENEQPIPGSHWGDDEAGLIKNTLYARLDTPVHSVLHEAGHWILMDDARRENLHTDAGGTSTEENAVCYLQILLSERIREMGMDRMCQDMDNWGYSFRLGSAKAWFNSDAEDAIEFLATRSLAELTR